MIYDKASPVAQVPGAPAKPERNFGAGGIACKIFQEHAHSRRVKRQKQAAVESLYNIRRVPLYFMPK